MKYSMTEPCPDCPFLKKNKGYAMKRLLQFAGGEFPCHKTAEYVEGDDEDDCDIGGYTATDDSQHCAGALIFNEKRDAPHQMIRIVERLGIYDRTKLNMSSKVR